MKFSGVLPACVTPFDENGQIDGVSLARLITYFRACGCSGVVVAGTNGEGPSLSAVEKRDLLRLAVSLSDGLPVILGIATPSLPEATWLCEQAGKSGAAGILVMAPGYFRNATERGVVRWMLELASASPVPMIAYNYPKFTGFTFTDSVVAELARHSNIVGFKDSSGDRDNLKMFRQAAPEADLLVGDETLLMDALQAGWHGSISGAANLVPHWLVKVVDAFKIDVNKGDIAFEVIKPVINEIRRGSQPAANKAVLAEWGLISRPDVRLPLEVGDGISLLETLQDRLGMKSENLGIP